VIDPTLDPVFNNPELQRLLQTFRRDQVRSIVQDVVSMGNTYAPVPYEDEHDRFTAYPGTTPRPTPGFWDVATGAAALENFTGRLLFKADKAISGAAAPQIGEVNFNPDQWFTDPKNRAYLQRLKGSQGQQIVRNWISGDYNDIKTASEFFSAVGFDLSESQYRDTLSEAEGPSGVFGWAAALTLWASWAGLVYSVPAARW
jgi:hypothetical protein